MVQCSAVGGSLQSDIRQCDGDLFGLRIYNPVWPLWVSCRWKVKACEAQSSRSRVDALSAGTGGDLTKKKTFVTHTHTLISKLNYTQVWECKFTRTLYYLQPDQTLMEQKCPWKLKDACENANAELKNCPPLNWTPLSAFPPCQHAICWFVKYVHVNGFAVPCGSL